MHYENVRPLATLLELHNEHIQNMTSSSNYRSDDFKPAGGAWNDYGMKTVQDSTSTTNFDDYSNSSSETTKQRGIWNRDVVNGNTANTRDFRGANLLPSGGQWTTPDRISDAQDLYSFSEKYTAPGGTTTDFTIAYPTDIPAAGTQLNKKTLDSIYDIYKNIEETSFKTNELFADGRFDKIGETNNTLWTNYTSGIGSDLAADGETKIFPES